MQIAVTPNYRRLHRRANIVAGMPHVAEISFGCFKTVLRGIRVRGIGEVQAIKRYLI